MVCQRSMVSERHMLGDTPIRLHHASVVFTAQSYNPSVLNPDFILPLKLSRAIGKFLRWFQ